MEADPVAPPASSLQIVVLPDEMDVTNASRFGADLEHAVENGAQVVIADLTLTTFIDSAGLRSLAQAWRAALRRGTDFRVVVPSPDVMRALEVSGVDQVLKLYPHTGAALDGAVPRKPAAVRMSGVKLSELGERHSAQTTDT
jgi:anti-sigma B factor antagonist